MKRTCNGCKALTEDINNYEPCCALGYDIKPGEIVHGYIISLIPCEECPKPKNTRDYLKAWNKRQKELNNDN